MINFTTFILRYNFHFNLISYSSYQINFFKYPFVLYSCLYWLVTRYTLVLSCFYFASSPYCIIVPMALFTFYQCHKFHSNSVFLLVLSKGMAKLAKIVREHVKSDMSANNVVQFGHHVGQQIQVKKCSWHVCTCSKHFRKHLLFDPMLSNLATMFANKSTKSGKSCGRIMQKSLKSIVTSTSLVAKWILE